MLPEFFTSRFRLRFFGRKITYFILSLGAAIGITFLIRDPTFTDSQDYVLFLLLFSIGLWLTEAVPPFTVALFIMAFLVFSLGNPRFNSAPQDVSKYTQTFSNAIIWLILGGFFLARALTKTRLDSDLLRFAIRVSGNQPRWILFGLMMTTMLASMLMSNTATTAMMIASMMPLFHHIGEKSPLAKTLLTGIPLAATVGGMGTVIGSPANAIAAGALESTKGKIDFLEWMYIGFPLAVSLTSLGWYMLVRSHLKMAEPVSLEFLRQANEEKPDRELRRQRRITIATLIVTLLLWMTGSLHNLSVAAVSAIPIVVLSMTGIIDGDDVNNLSWETLLLVAGGLSLGIALQDTGVLAHFAGKITGMKLHPLVLLSALGFITMIVTNIMSSTAAATILIPLALTMLPGAKPEAALIVGLCASTGLLLPISTPPNAIAYSTGYLQQKDFRRGGILIGLAGPILILLWVLLLT